MIPSRVNPPALFAGKLTRLRIMGREARSELEVWAEQGQVGGGRGGPLRSSPNASGAGFLADPGYDRPSRTGPRCRGPAAPSSPSAAASPRSAAGHSGTCRTPGRRRAGSGPAPRGPGPRRPESARTRRHGPAANSGAPPENTSAVSMRLTRASMHWSICRRALLHAGRADTCGASLAAEGHGAHGEHGDAEARFAQCAIFHGQTLPNLRQAGLPLVFEHRYQSRRHLHHPRTHGRQHTRKAAHKEGSTQGRQHARKAARKEGSTQGRQHARKAAGKEGSRQEIARTRTRRCHRAPRKSLHRRKATFVQRPAGTARASSPS